MDEMLKLNILEAYII